MKIAPGEGDRSEEKKADDHAAGCAGAKSPKLMKMITSQPTTVRKNAHGNRPLICSTVVQRDSAMALA